jgi:hypothetical protein
MRPTLRRTIISISFTAGLLGLPSLAGAAQGVTVDANCAPTKTRVRVVEDVVGTGSATYASVPSSRIAFTTTAAGCVMIRFSAEAAGGPISNLLNVQALLDGTIVGSPPDTVFAGTANADDPTPAVRSMEYVFVKVPAGDHFIVMQFKEFGGGLAQLGKRTMVLQYQ